MKRKERIIRRVETIRGIRKELHAGGFDGYAVLFYKNVKKLTTETMTEMLTLIQSIGSLTL